MEEGKEKFRNSNKFNLKRGRNSLSSSYSSSLGDNNIELLNTFAQRHYSDQKDIASLSNNGEKKDEQQEEEKKVNTMMKEKRKQRRRTSDSRVMFRRGAMNLGGDSEGSMTKMMNNFRSMNPFQKRV